jgi:alpha-glucosidase
MTRNGWRSVAVALAAASAAVLAPSAEATGRHRATSVSSPDHRIAVAFHVDRQGRPVYRVSRNGAAVLADSALGFQFAGAPALDDDLEVRDVRSRR